MKKVDPTPRRSRLGIYFALVYLLIVIAVFTLTASSKPSGFGYEWIPVVWLAIPWSMLGDNMPILIFGFFANAGILYLLGTLFEKLLRQLFWK